MNKFKCRMRKRHAGSVLRLFIIINLKHLDCSTGRGSLLEYGGVAHGGRSWGVSMLDQVTGRQYGCRMLLGKQISSQICPRIPSIAERDVILRQIWDLYLYPSNSTRKQKIPDPLRKELLHQPQLSWPVHPSQLHNLHTAEITKPWHPKKKNLWEAQKQVKKKPNQ